MNLNKFAVIITCYRRNATSIRRMDGIVQRVSLMLFNHEQSLFNVLF